MLLRKYKVDDPPKIAGRYTSKQEYIPVAIKENNVDLYWKKAKALLKRKDTIKVTKVINTPINNVVTKTQTITNTRIITKKQIEKKDDNYDYDRL